MSEPTYKESLRDKINHFIEDNSPSSPSAGVLWEVPKAFLRGHIIQHAPWKKRTAKNSQAVIEEKVKEAEANFKLYTSSANLTLLSKLKYEYIVIESKKVEFALFRAHQKQFEEGDKASKMLTRYIKIKELACIIPGIRDLNVQLHSDTRAINNIFKAFYIDLYSSELEVDNEEINSFLVKLNLPSVTEAQQKILDNPITVKEIMDVIQKQKDKDPSDCKSYRPILSIRQDHKILVKIDKIITHLINPDQVGFIRPRNFSDNIITHNRRFIDIMWASQNVNSPIAAISLNAEKAFDRVEWPFLIATLKVFGFGKGFMSWIRLLYSNPGQQF